MKKTAKRLKLDAQAVRTLAVADLAAVAGGDDKISCRGANSKTDPNC